MRCRFRNRFYTATSLSALAGPFASLIAAALLLSVNVGFVAVYHVAKMHWYHQQLVAKPGESTVTLHLTKDQFYNGTKKYEWKINGESYDMRSYTVTDSGVTVIAVHDPYEHELTNILTAGFRHDDKSNSQPVRQWVKILSQPAVIIHPYVIVVFPSTTSLVFAVENFLPREYAPELLDPPLAVA